ncbi:MAG: ABC-type transport auxiliary lipoprotein family protein [Phenylobacterium sp.]
MIRPMLRLALLAACAASLGGCISLLPKTKPAQLYRFGAPPAASPATPAPNAVAVYLSNGKFQEESSDDRILTVTGGKAAYIADSRWVSPAEILFEEAVGRAFDSSPIRMIARGQPGRFAYAERIDVRTFEARYDSGAKAAPTVVVRLHAALTRADQSSVGEQDFEARVPASANRVGAIVAAFNTAVGDVVGKIVAWTEKNAV